MKETVWKVELDGINHEMAQCFAAYRQYFSSEGDTVHGIFKRMIMKQVKAKGNPMKSFITKDFANRGSYTCGHFI